jgi:hypothetical protein
MLTPEQQCIGEIACVGRMPYHRYNCKALRSNTSFFVKKERVSCLGCNDMHSVMTAWPPADPARAAGWARAQPGAAPPGQCQRLLLGACHAQSHSAQGQSAQQHAARRGQERQSVAARPGALPAALAGHLQLRPH